MQRFTFFMRNFLDKPTVEGLAVAERTRVLLIAVKIKSDVSQHVRLYRCCKFKVQSMANFTTPAADMAFVNGKIVTVNAKDEITEALAVRGKKILRVGRREYVDPTIGPDTKLIDLQGRTLLPGFIENHIHMTNSPQRYWVDCSYATSPSIVDIREKIAAR